jgi:hypothetical protein
MRSFLDVLLFSVKPKYVENNIMCLPRQHFRVLRLETWGVSILALSACMNP